MSETIESSLSLLMEDRCLLKDEGECEKVLIHLWNSKATVKMLKQQYFLPSNIYCSMHNIVWIWRYDL